MRKSKEKVFLLITFKVANNREDALMNDDKQVRMRKNAKISDNQL